MIRKHTLLTILFIYSGLIINAQEHKFKFGLLADYGILEPDVKGIVAEKYELFSTGSTLDGYRIGVFCNLKVRRGFWNSELSYFNNRSLIQFHNLRWQEDLAKYGTASIDASGMYLNNMVRLSINRGLIIAKSFSIEAGLIGALQKKDKYFSGYPDSYFTDPTTMTKVIYRVSDGFNRFLILGNIKLAYLFGPLTVYGTLERSLTAVSEYVDYESSRYPLKYSIKTFAMGITYTLYTTKK